MSSNPDGCARDQAAPCQRAFAGLVGGYGYAEPGPAPARTGKRLRGVARAVLIRPGVPAGTAVTPHYVDNASARVAPWCDCRATGNRREECEAFRGLFTRNPCLGEGAGGPPTSPGPAE